ncbi:MAG: GNAT family N-acetyltransferase [Acidimicrobiales bacterium]
METFTSGNPELDDWVRRFAHTAHASGETRVYVATGSGHVVGVYAMSNGAVAWEQAPGRVRQGLARHRIPVTLITRLAVDSTVQGQGVGRFLLSDALRRVVDAAAIVGSRAVMVHAKDEDAAGFYERYGFVGTEVSPYHLVMLLKDVRRQLGI